MQNRGKDHPGTGLTSEADQQKPEQKPQQKRKRPLVTFAVPEEGGQITFQPAPVICEDDYDAETGEPQKKKQRRAVIVIKPTFVISTCIGNHCDADE